MIVGNEREDLIVAADLTIDEVLVLADTLGGIGDDFPHVLGIRKDNIPYEEIKRSVWGAVRQELTGKNILDSSGAVHEAVAKMLQIATRPERTLECRWWRTDKKLIRFAVCRRGPDHVIICRNDERIVSQFVAASAGLAGMVEAVIGRVAGARMGPVTGPSTEIETAVMPEDLTQFGCDIKSAATLLTAIRERTEWVHIVATETLPGGTVVRPHPSAGILDSRHGRVVSLPKEVRHELHGTFLSGTPENLARTLSELTGFLPSGSWENL
ncbi:ESX secretion-associated protein EspG [Mycobacteroides salmoniphilum]|uniref:ESX-1 secretion-associated protein EspG1 n=1 Tax=Mycobacteroides salmoniphilum TaxID=404941 RepID=A0A4V3I1E9_9MYCO|nr:ESX secretion-associated protein EspG [Mycobacteroides salmoniphilum]TEA09124.1 ESX-1 secretion-associated protein EspG1 [Mycobacteroides salmoniphilum]